MREIYIRQNLNFSLGTPQIQETLTQDEEKEFLTL